MVCSYKASENLHDEMRSWNVSDILDLEQPPFEVETIPEKFDTWEDYTKYFKKLILVEIWYEIHSALKTISGGLDVEPCEKIRKENNAYKFQLILPDQESLPGKKDLMLLSAGTLRSSEQIRKDPFCTMLKVWSVFVISHPTKRPVMSAQILKLPQQLNGDLIGRPLKAMHLTNLRTHECSWDAITKTSKRGSKLVNLILNKNNAYGECGQCTDETKKIKSDNMGFGLNESQSNAVAACIASVKCSHRPSLQLIWGPPGTGKTKTVSIILHMLLMMKGGQKILASAPTNTAILQMASHLVRHFKVLPGSYFLEPTHSRYSLRDIILYGNKNRMKFKADIELSEIFLERRVDELSGLLSTFNAAVGDLVVILKYCISQSKTLSPGMSFSETLNCIVTYASKLVCRLPTCLMLHHINDAANVAQHLTVLLDYGVMERTKLVFCTPCLSSRLANLKYDILVINEAANLKECEAMIPLTIDGIKHAVLIGDDKQLPSVVKSPTAEMAKMHPSISEFPNKRFYDGRILDGPNVKKCDSAYLTGNMYGTYSFIDVEAGVEENIGQSVRNKAEAAVAANIVYRLAEACFSHKKKTTVGVISQYAAQVTALQEAIGHCHNHEFFSFEIHTVDSFQGDEKDIIILSTVRSNRDGFVGFIDSDNRANVALTRARNHLWILGNEETLINSGSVWSDLVKDAKERHCFFTVYDDGHLARTIDELNVMPTSRKRRKVADMGHKLTSPSPYRSIQCSRDAQQAEGAVEAQAPGQAVEVAHTTSLEAVVNEQSTQIIENLEGLSELARKMLKVPLTQFSPSHSPSMKGGPSLSAVEAQSILEGLAEPAAKAEKDLTQFSFNASSKMSHSVSKEQLASLSPSLMHNSNQFDPDAQLTDENLNMRRDVPQVRSPDATSPAAAFDPLTIDPSLSIQCSSDIRQAEGAAGAQEPGQAVEAAVFLDTTSPDAAVDAQSNRISRKRPAVSVDATSPAAADDSVTVEILDTLPPGANAIVRTPINYRGQGGKKARKTLLGLNFYEQKRSATDERFWSIKQDDLYNSLYGSDKVFARHQWIDWPKINHSGEFKKIEELCRGSRIHGLMITITKRFLESILLDPPLHEEEKEYHRKIDDGLSKEEEKEFNFVNPTLVDAAKRLVGKTISPRNGNRGVINPKDKIILYHILFGKPFDFVDAMLWKMQKTRSDSKRSIPYAPYIMLLIERAIGGEFVPESGGEGYVKHKRYNVETLEIKKGCNDKASKPNKAFHVTPLCQSLRALGAARAGAPETSEAAEQPQPHLTSLRDPVAAKQPQPVDHHAQVGREHRSFFPRISLSEAWKYCK
ncbi:hypothetical protein ACP70R_040083 [Stipagrostis hirtigluma subsp. patula]